MKSSHRGQKEIILKIKRVKTTGFPPRYQKREATEHVKGQGLGGAKAGYIQFASPNKKVHLKYEAIFEKMILLRAEENHLK